MKDFSYKLIEWYNNNKRDLPWRNTQDPFRIWLSEIILQQTRVDQGMSYYLKFTQRFNNVAELAKATEDEVLSMWQGLGYYSRGRNLLKAAQQVMNEFDGVFPTQFSELKKLKGVGDYSAAAISSFAANEKVAVVDGNVFRVLSRVFDVATPIDTGAGKKEFTELANALIDENSPATFNQAIMEFGALLCTPKKPLCTFCTFNDTCVAYNTGKVFELPIKAKKIKKKERYFQFDFFEQNGEVFLQKRTDDGIWANMYQIPLTEVSVDDANTKTPIFETKHILTHQNLHCKFYKKEVAKPMPNGFWVPLNKLDKYALPRVIDKFFQHYFN